MQERISIHEARRRAPAHYFAKAENARYSAYVLAEIDEEIQETLAKRSGYGGASFIAMGEAFRREASISLELIIKAVIAQRAENLRRLGKQADNVPMTHDVVQLWKQAQLPNLGDADQYRLIRVKNDLMWASRYAAPRKDVYYDNAREEIKPFEDVVTIGKALRIVRPRSFDFDDFDRLYSIALEAYSKLQPSHGK